MPSGVRYDLDQTCGTMFLAFGDHDDGIDVSTTDLLSLGVAALRPSSRYDSSPATAACSADLGSIKSTLVYHGRSSGKQHGASLGRRYLDLSLGRVYP